MYVQYRIPAQQNHKFPIILAHGGGLTGSTYETTPDGREGWATYFARNGFAVYEVDFPGRGRSGYDPTIINQAKAQNDISILPVFRRTTNESAWTAFRFGPQNLVPFPGVQYPLDAIDQLSAQGVPYGEVTLSGGSGTWAPALADLLDKIGPAIVLVHSQSGPIADMVVGLRPQLVKATVNVEGNQLTIPTDAQIAAYRNVPDLELFGDNVDPSFTARYEGRKAVVTRITNAGGDAQIIKLPEIGLQGNTHMMMQDKTNLQIADYIIKWIDTKTK
jgi:pimeloyl-ACP methyl ester carboxylesterase